MDVMPQLPALQVVVPLFGALLAAFLRRGVTAWRAHCCRHAG